MIPYMKEFIEMNLRGEFSNVGGGASSPQFLHPHCTLASHPASTPPANAAGQSEEKRMQHRHLVFMLMNAIAVSNAMGQEPGRGARRPPSPTDIARELGLDAAQVPQFVQILEDQHAKRRALQELADADHLAMRQKMDALHEETRTRLGSVLNADQLARFEQLRPRLPEAPPYERERHAGPPDRH